MRSGSWHYLRILVVLAFMAVYAVSHANSESIAGSYKLYEEGDSSGRVVTTMVITSWSETTFLIRGSGWVGKGEFEGSSGYYDWKFDDGRTGRTTFNQNADGTLKGHVLGSGLDWWYIARRVIPKT